MVGKGLNPHINSHKLMESSQRSWCHMASLGSKELIAVTRIDIYCTVHTIDIDINFHHISVCKMSRGVAVITCRGSLALCCNASWTTGTGLIVWWAEQLVRRHTGTGLIVWRAEQLVGRGLPTLFHSESWLADGKLRASKAPGPPVVGYSEVVLKGLGSM